MKIDAGTISRCRGRKGRNMHRVAKILVYFLDAVPKAGRTQVVKFLYLADLEARKVLGRPLTGLDYILDHHGPFDPDILATLDAMEARGHIRAEQYPYRGNTCYTYETTNKAPRASF